MGRSYDDITAGVSSFIDRRHVFFVATAPLNGAGHVNVSPKGMDSLRVLAPDRIAYVDLTGSGAETIAHVRQNGRITLMFCSFDDRPRMVRVYGRGTVHEPDDVEFTRLRPAFPNHRAIRAIIAVAVTRVADSCGYGVPLMEFVAERSRLAEWGDRKTDAELVAYQQKENTVSLDGLPALRGPN